VADVIRATAIPRVVKDERALAGQALEIFEQIDTVGDKHCLRAASYLLKEQPQVVFCLHAAFARHGFTPENTKAAAKRGP
jgi:hypothetical protein